MGEKNFSIGHLAREAATKVQTIRYYEQIGMMPEPVRTGGNQRAYGADDLRRLAFIRHSRELGFSLDDIRSLLALADNPERSCADADRLASLHLDEVESRITRLEAMKKELKRMIGECRGGISAECRILGVLADHNLCRHHH